MSPPLIAAPVRLSSARYVLGEYVVHHSALADMPGRAQELGMAPMPGLWGWGSVRRTDLTLDELATRSGRATLTAAGQPPVDALLLCSTRFPGGAADHGGFVGRIMSGLGLSDVAFHGVTLHRCANLLASIGLAEALVAAGVHRTVLVVTTDRVEAHDTRIEKYALFSDGAASCLVSADPHGDDVHDIVSTAAARDTGSLDRDDEISADLAREANRRLFEDTGLGLPDVRALMHANLVTPLVVLKEKQAGFTGDQLFLDNTGRFGHCFAADPLINLVDRTAQGHLGPGDHVVLATSVPGERFAVLLRRCAGPTHPAGPDHPGEPAPPVGPIPARSET